jgi:hypothetical protein
MRPNHQNNKRMRGRNRSGGKGPNPLSRSYESNGPDVKIRGTAQHIAEKYLQLARDAQASGDPVTAESYHQHAEHYLRLIAAAQEQFRQQNPSYRPFEVGGEDGDDEGDDPGPYSGGPQPDVRFPQMEGDDYQQQPRQQQPREQREWQPREQREQREWQPRESREPREWQPRGDQQPREPREPREWQPRGDQQPRVEQQPREQRDFQPREPRDFQPRDGQQPRRDDRFGRRGPRPDRPEFRERGDRPERQDRPERAPTTEDEAGNALPAFITAPVRTPVIAEDEPMQAAPAPAAAAEDEAGRFPLRQRRRRAPRRAEGDAEAPVPTGEPAAE